MDDLLKLDPTLKPKLESLCGKFRDANRPVRDLRNKVIAHLDLPAATKTVPPPSEATVNEVRAALDALAEFMNSIQIHFGEAPTAYGMFGMMGGGAKELVAMLQTADKYFEHQKSGAIPWDDGR